MTTRDLADATALQTARMVATGELTALEACDAAIARIEAGDGSIHAVVVRDFERARVAARAIDASRAKHDARPLLGVPMTVKESNDVAGLPTTWGIPDFAGRLVTTDAVAVQRLKAAGAVILGKTNTPVALADWQAVNPVYGRTINPHDPARSPGGSSGGAAAALAARLVPLELGSDIGGSIRVPAHMCGVFGHKPTYGLVPLKGHEFPGSDSVDAELAVVGPMARCAEDLAAALAVLAGPVDGPYALTLPPPRHAALADYRVLVLEDHPSVATDAAVRGPLHALAGALERLGVKLRRTVDGLPDLAQAHAHYGQMLVTVMSRGAPGAKPIDAHAWMNLLDAQMRVARQWRAVFSEVDVVLMPPFGVPAFPHDDTPDWTARTLTINGAIEPYPRQVTWPGVATFPGLPATAAPIARTREGLPVGVQIMGAKFEDRTTIAFAGLLTREGLAAALKPEH